jgi:hypothetical protein
MGFKKRRDKRPEAIERAGDSPHSSSGFEHSSGATNLEGLLGEHTLDDAAAPVVPKGYRARSVAKSENRR